MIYKLLFKIQEKTKWRFNHKSYLIDNTLKRGFTLYPRSGRDGSEGFTLIELLTVIAIIGILTGLLTVSFLGVRVRGRDAQRKHDIKQIQSAVELYRADNDTYPPTSTFGAGTCGASFTQGANTYMTQIPCDPQTGGPYAYYFNNATSYFIASCLENTKDKDAATTAPSWWPVGATLPTCNPQVYYFSRNP